MCFIGDLHNEHKLQVSASLFGEGCRARISRAIKLTPYRFRKCRFERVDYVQFNYTFARFRRVGEPKVIKQHVQQGGYELSGKHFDAKTAQGCTKEP